MDDQTVPFRRAVAGNDLYHRVVDKADPVLVAVLSETLALVGGNPDSLDLQQLGEILPEIERRLRLECPEKRAMAMIATLRDLILRG